MANLPTAKKSTRWSSFPRYETADDIQVYLWNQGTYYKVSLADLNPQDYKLIGWYDNQGHSAGNKIRLLVAVRTN